MVFTGDHLNKPPMIDELQRKCVLTKERADDLRRLPLQDCDVLLHEAGPPPIHTPLEVLMELPERIKKRLFVVHTSALPKNCDLRVAPAGTAGTIRIDELHTAGIPTTPAPPKSVVPNSIPNSQDTIPPAYTAPPPESVMPTEIIMKNGLTSEPNGVKKVNLSDDVDSVGSMERTTNFSHVVGENRQESLLPKSDSQPALQEPQVSPSEQHESALAPIDDRSKTTEIWNEETRKEGQPNPSLSGKVLPPLVFLRPTCVSDAWFILNLLSNVPFLSRCVFDILLATVDLIVSLDV